jgi:hypothetical protein
MLCKKSIVNKALEKKSKKSEKKKQESEVEEEKKARFETLYEHSVAKTERAAALAKKVQSENDRECTFKPKTISKSQPRKSSPKKTDWEPKQFDSPSKKTSPSKKKYEREEDMPAHERLFKKAQDAAAKRK